jgi:hypothetical protein
MKLVKESLIDPVRFNESSSVLFAVELVTILIVTKSPGRQSRRGSYKDPAVSFGNTDPFCDDACGCTLIGNSAGFTNSAGAGAAA